MIDAAKPGWRSRGPLRIGEWLVDPDSNEISDGGTVRRLRPLLMDLLLRLASEPGRVVLREELLEEVWPRRMVNDEVLSRAVAELRVALGDQAKQPRFVETLPKVGYRLVAAVGPADAVVEGARNSAAAGPVHAGASPLTDPGEGTRRSAAARPAGIPAARSATDAPEPTSQGQVPADRRGLSLAAAAAALTIAAAASFIARPTSNVAQLATQLGRAQVFDATGDYDLSPRFAPDGKSVIHAQGDGTGTRLVIRTVDGAGLSSFAKPETLLYSPVFVPERAGPPRRIAFWQRDAGGCAIVLRELASGAERRLLDCTREPRAVFDVAPDGGSLVVSLRPAPKRPHALARVALDDGAVTLLTTPEPSEGDDVRPRYSPDGARIVFTRGNRSHGRLWLLDLRPGGQPRMLPAPEGQDWGAAWLGAAGPLLVAADWGGFRALHRVDPDRGGAELIGARGARFPDVAPDGAIVFESAQFRADLWEVDAADPDAPGAVLWPAAAYSNQPEYAPDGRAVVFVSTREGAEALYVGARGGPARRLAAGPGWRHIRPHWTRDGTALLAVRSPVGANLSGPHEAVRIDLADGHVRVLSMLGTDVADVRELGDSSLLVAQRAGGTMRLGHWREGALRMLPLPPVGDFQAAGDDLVYLESDRGGLVRCRIAAVDCSPLPITLADADRYHWHLARGAVWFRESSATGPAALVRLGLGDGRRNVFAFAPTGNGTSLAASPDGTRLIVTREAPPVIHVHLARAAP